MNTRLLISIRDLELVGRVDIHFFFFSGDVFFFYLCRIRIRISVSS